MNIVSEVKKKRQGILFSYIIIINAQIKTKMNGC